MEASGSDTTARDSKLLYALCCDVGVSKRDWERRLYKSDVISTCQTYGCMCNCKVPCKVICCGSSADGTAFNFLGSDTDFMFVPEGTKVLEYGPVCPNGASHTFQMIHTEHPAYVRLQFMSTADMRVASVAATPSYCDVDEVGRFVLNGNKLKGIIGHIGNARVKGPAVKETVTETDEVDHVIGLRCESWPSVSAEWPQRARPYNWPEPSVIRDICNHGCEVVAVGNPASASPHLEWRLSSSYGEKTLIRTFNIYQIQSYFLLKMVLAFLIKPKVPHTLSSYHMKTVMLHVVETTDPAEWTEANLTRCFMKCLEKLHRFVLDGYCPQYFIPGHNLFEHRLQDDSQTRLLEVLDELMSQGWACIFKCEPFSNGFLSCGHRFPRCPCFIKHLEETRTSTKTAFVVTCVINVIESYCNASQGTADDIIESITTLAGAKRGAKEHGIAHCPDEGAASIMQLLIKGLIGYRLLVATTGKHADNPALLNPILQVAERYLEESCDVDMASGRLKLATFLYQTGKKDACIDVVASFLSKVTVHTMTLCGDADRLSRAFQSYGLTRRLRSLTELVGFDTRALLCNIAFPVTFSFSEMDCAPSGIRCTAQHKPMLTKYDRFTNNVMYVDPLIHALYLLVICHKDLGRLGKSRRCLELMSRIIRSPHLCCVFYPEVANLLLDYCVRYVIGVHPQ